MTDRHVHAAIFDSTDPATRARLTVKGTIANVALNVPAGGCWREVPVGVARHADIPPLGELPAPAAAE